MTNNLPQVIVFQNVADHLISYPSWSVDVCSMLTPQRLPLVVQPQRRRQRWRHRCVATGPECKWCLLHQLRTSGWRKNGKKSSLSLHTSIQNEGWLRMESCLGPIGRITRVHHVAEIPWWPMSKTSPMSSLNLHVVNLSALNYLLTYSQSRGCSMVYQHIQ